MCIKVYLAAPYGRNLSTEERVRNVNKVIAVARELIKLGYNPFVPHLYHYVHQGWLASPSEEEWSKLCSAWIQHCDALLRMPGASKGSDKEVLIATEKGIPVYYSIEELRNYTLRE